MLADAELSALVAANGAWLSALLRGLTRSEADADDAFQEVWMRVIRSGVGSGSARAYLAKVARSVMVDRHRRGFRCVVTADAPNDDGETLADALVDASPGPGERVERAATHEDVLSAVRSLPDGPREVVLMRIEGELTFREIADELGIPLGTALTWMRYATVRLKKAMGGLQ